VHAAHPIHTRPEVRRFLNGIGRSTHKLARRDYALFSTIVYTGLRLSEAARALWVWGDVDLRRRRLLVRLAKGGRQEMRHISGRLLHTLIALRRDVEDVIDLDRWPLFPSRGRDALSSRAVQYRFAFWLARSGIRQRMSVHSLRHTFATLLYRAIGDLLLVNRALGHRDIRSTQRYAHVDDRRLVQALNRL
jgi:integrase/recombinase XerC